MSSTVRRDLVSLTPLQPSDVDDILTWVNDHSVVGNLATFSGAPLTRAQELTYVHRMMSSVSDFVWSVRAADDGRYLGQVGLHAIHHRSKVGRLACVIARKDDMGKGFGSAAIAAALDLAFADLDAADATADALGLHKVWLMVFATNDRARRTYARLGFVEEGLLRDEYFHQGTWRDMVRMSLLASEWPQDSPAAAES